MSLDFANALKGGGGDNFAYLFRITPFYVSSLMCFLKKKILNRGGGGGKSFQKDNTISK